MGFTDPSSVKRIGAMLNADYINDERMFITINMKESFLYEKKFGFDSWRSAGFLWCFGQL
jgi:hypothetical protein